MIYHILVVTGLVVLCFYMGSIATSLRVMTIHQLQFPPPEEETDDHAPH